MRPDTTAERAGGRLRSRGGRRPAYTLLLGVVCCLALVTIGTNGQQPRPGQRGAGFGPPDSGRKKLLVWGDMRGGGSYHPAVSHAMGVIEQLGRTSEVYDAYIRTDSQLITKKPISVNADGRDWRVRENLDFFDAIFFYGMREIPITDDQMTDLLAFVHEDGKGFVAVHTAGTAFQRFPEFGVMMGATYDGHPWGQVEAPLIVEDPAFPAMKHFPPIFSFREEMYQPNFSRDNVRVLLRLDASQLPANDRVHRTDGDFPQAWAKSYGKGRVFFSAIGHAAETWDDPRVQTMYLEAIKWAMGLTEADVTPRPKPDKDTP